MGSERTFDTAQLETLPAGPAEVDSCRVAGRYTLRSLLGTGGAGAVWAAIDERTGEEVAVKLLDAVDRRRVVAIRQEVNALRWLRLPGVIRLRDDGLEADRYFIAMDRVVGRPFPGIDGPVSWTHLRPLLAELAGVLARVHLAGVVHRDLKPANALVDVGGRVVLLDFGLAVGERLSREEQHGFAGTPRYAAPEQCRGEPCGPAADLYALGVMAFEALTGQVPHAASSWRALLSRRATEPSPPLRTLAPEITEEAAALIDRLLAADPADRPESAADVLAALGVRAATLSAIPPRVSTRTLRRLFEGPDTFLLRDLDAARLLRARAGEQPAALAAELQAWIRGDLARFGPTGRLVVERVALAQLGSGLRLEVPRSEAEADLSAGDQEVLAWIRLAWPYARPDMLAKLSGLTRVEVEASVARLTTRGLVWPLPRGRIGAAASGEPAPGWSRARKQAAQCRLARLVPRGEHRIRHLLLGGSPVREVLAEIRAGLGTGTIPSQLAQLELGLQLARQEEDSAAEVEILRAWTLLALDETTLGAWERAQVALGDARGVEPLHMLLASERARHLHDLERAQALLDGSGPLDDEVLEQWRRAVSYGVARVRGLSAQADYLEEIRTWGESGPPGRRVRYESWLSLLRIMQERYEEALVLSTRCVAARRPGPGRNASFNHQASALIMLGRLREAVAVLGRLCRDARRQRDAQNLSQAAWKLRLCRYQMGENLQPRPSRIAAVQILRPHLAGPWAFLEAVLAWRGGRRDLHATLATAALARLREQGDRGDVLLAEALVQIASPPVPREQALQLAENAARDAAPHEAIQVLGLLRRAVVDPPPEWRETILQLAQQVPVERWSQRLEIISVDEALA